ncbi:potassium-transporting ATPase subunit KdpB [Dysgonomonas sp. Marseille-P4677]|uniref:potassium-transporting ATPase subunit KdpB n=1 Tax=Dysgonomonas sp. Marseille-P4677 TaxID=2364790 RepID=UPI00191486E6|nr:potassium-transporting ATPase subunit KdpB [Dysgonomonas sp. Marseille-P4677]MBK5722239.1 potassium-transporting ATPase subunit KdpB [Dysgonomonas sp. Marseille-P4677]
MKSQNKSFLNKELLIEVVKTSFIKLRPDLLIKNPVIFIVAIGATLTTITVITGLIKDSFSIFNLQIAIWLWITVLFANFSESIAEGRGKAQAQSLKANRSQTKARRLKEGKEYIISAENLKRDDIVVCETGDIIPSDGEIIEGIATVDESAITGESAPVIRESGGDRNAVTGGTKVLSDKIIVKITSDAGNTFIDRMIALVEGAKRQKTPNEIALTILLSGLSIVFILAVVTLPAFFGYSLHASGLPQSDNLSLPVLIALLVCLIPTTIGGLLSAIGISGMDRLMKRNVIATSGRAIEAAGDVDVLLLDKTGTITLGNRMATDFIPADGISVNEIVNAAQLSSLSDETPEGRSVVILAKEKFNIRGRDLGKMEAEFIPFTAQTRMSGVDITIDGKVQRIRKGSVNAIRSFVYNNNGFFPENIEEKANELAQQGSTPLIVAIDSQVLGIIHLKDIVKGGIKERFAQLRKMGIKTVMITGDNPLTAAAIAAEAGVDDFLAEAKPEDKLRKIREEQANGRLVGMIGDGTNDAPALAQSDVGIAMSSGTQAAREAGNMVDLDSNPTKLIEVVEVGKQLLMTRGALTTFSIANDVAKYFAIIPAIAVSLYAGPSGKGALSVLNIMRLSSPENAILSAIIFNALIIIFLIPLALKGVKYRAESPSKSLLRNLCIYGFGGIVTPFICIKMIDLLLNIF